jgi:perosamine synthetase
MTERWRYLGPPGQSLPVLFRSWLGSGRMPDWEQLRGGRVEWTTRCTVAIRRVLDSWAIGPGDQVLMPSYHCGSEVDAVMSTGAEVVLYRIGADARIDEADLYRRVTPRTRVVYVVHYFGWSHRLSRLAAHCRAKGLKLLEDCALSLFSSDGAWGIGTIGDAAVYSLTKTLGVTDGGAAVWRDGTTNTHAGSPSGPWHAVRGSARLVRRDILRRLSRSQLGAVAWALSSRSSPDEVDAQYPPPIPAGYYFDGRARDRRISRAARAAAAGVDPATVIALRRRNYERLAESLGSTGLVPLVESLPAGVCPLVLPVIVNDRHRLVSDLADRGIEATAWWAGYHRAFDLADFDDARFLKDRIVALPVHQDLTDRDVEYMVACLRARTHGAHHGARGGRFVASSAGGI